MSGTGSPMERALAEVLVKNKVTRVPTLERADYHFLPYGGLFEGAPEADQEDRA